MLQAMNQTSLFRSLAAVCLGFISMVATAQPRQVEPPLHTSGHDILDSAGHRVRLTSVNWYGFDQQDFVAGGLDHAPLATIVQEIVDLGVNSVRLPWANETLENNPQVPDYAVKANPQLRGRHAMEVMDAVVRALAGAHIMVILDNHVSKADWCCSETDGNGLWYNADYPESKWLTDWQTIVRRYKRERWVVGAYLRNELRNKAAWGGTDPACRGRTRRQCGAYGESPPADHGREPGLLDQLRWIRQTSAAVEDR
jgi:endoglucanase